MTQRSTQIGSVIVAAALAACGSQKPPQAATTGPQGPLTLEELMPLEDDTVSSFETENDLGETGMFVLEINRPRPSTAELSIAGDVQRLIIEKKGISRARGGYLLRVPFEEGATFRGAFGTVTLSKVNHEHEVPAGRFDRCVTTVEESTRPPKRATSVFCSEVGLVELVVEGAGDADVLRLEARLKTHGPRVDLRRPERPRQRTSPHQASPPGSQAPASQTPGSRERTGAGSQESGQNP